MLEKDLQNLVQMSQLIVNWLFIGLSALFNTHKPSNINASWNYVK